MIATLPDLRKLSGLRQVAAIKRWLRANGVPFMIQPDGSPVSTLDAINRAMYGGRKNTEPDFTPPPCSPRRSTPRTGASTGSTGTAGIR